MEHYDGGEDELTVISNDVVPTLCPISEKDMVAPYVNVGCNHMYSLEGLLNLLARVYSVNIPLLEKFEEISIEIKLQWPIIGCGSILSRIVLQKAHVPDRTSETLYESSILDVSYHNQN